MQNWYCWIICLTSQWSCWRECGESNPVCGSWPSLGFQCSAVGSEPSPCRTCGLDDHYWVLCNAQSEAGLPPSLITGPLENTAKYSEKKQDCEQECDHFIGSHHYSLQKSYSEVRGYSLSLHVGGLSGVMYAVPCALRLYRHKIFSILIMKIYR